MHLPLPRPHQPIMCMLTDAVRLPLAQPLHLTALPPPPALIQHPLGQSLTHQLESAHGHVIESVSNTESGERTEEGVENDPMRGRRVIDQEGVHAHETGTVGSNQGVVTISTLTTEHEAIMHMTPHDRIPHTMFHHRRHTATPQPMTVVHHVINVNHTRQAQLRHSVVACQCLLSSMTQWWVESVGCHKMRQLLRTVTPSVKNHQHGQSVDHVPSVLMHTQKSRQRR